MGGDDQGENSFPERVERGSGRAALVSARSICNVR